MDECYKVMMVDSPCPWGGKEVLLAMLLGWVLGWLTLYLFLEVAWWLRTRSQG